MRRISKTQQRMINKKKEGGFYASKVRLFREEREAHSKEMQSLKDQFALMLAAKDNEIAALKAKNGD